MEQIILSTISLKPLLVLIHFVFIVQSRFYFCHPWDQMNLYLNNKNGNKKKNLAAVFQFKPFIYSKFISKLN